MRKRNRNQTTTHKREPIPKKLRFEILSRDNFTCRYCGQSAPDVVLHADHVKPVAKGGTNDPSNLVAACSACNGGKGDAELPIKNGPPTIEEQKRDPRWIELKEFILDRDEHKCRCCGTTETAGVRIKTINRYLWDMPSNEIVTLCDDCAKKAFSRLDAISIGLFDTFIFNDSNAMGFLSSVSELVYGFGSDNLFFKHAEKILDSIVETSHDVQIEYNGDE